MANFSNFSNLNGTDSIAIDARLVQTSAGGDSTYWTGLLYGFLAIAPNLPLRLISDVQKPDGIPWSEKWKWICIPSKSSRLWSLVQFPLAARKLGAKIIHGQYNLSPLVGNRGVTTIHDVSYFIGAEWFSNRDRFLLQKFVPKSAKRCKAVIAVSETSKSEILRYIPMNPDKVVVTPLACPPWIKPSGSAEASQRLKKKFGLDSPYLFTLGTKWARKNQALAIAAIEGLDSSIPHPLVIAGKGSESNPKSENVQALGYVTNEDVCDLYSNAALFLFPSLHEGFGIPILEAFQCGCPVVCGIGGAMPEVAAGASILVSSYEVDAWKVAISDALRESSKLNELRGLGYQRVKEFSWEECACQTLKAYQKVIQ